MGKQKKKKNKNNNNKRHKNNKRKNKNKNKGMFGGLHGAFGGDTKSNKEDAMNVSDDDDMSDMVEECECHSVDGNPKATPASASNYYNQDDEEDGDNVQCRQM